MEGGCRPTIPRARLGQVGIVMILSLSHRRQARGGRGRHCCRTKKCSAERCSKKSSSVARTRAPHAASPRPAAACQPSPPPPPFRPSAPPSRCARSASLKDATRNARRSETLAAHQTQPALASSWRWPPLLFPPAAADPLLPPPGGAAPAPAATRRAPLRDPQLSSAIERLCIAKPVCATRNIEGGLS